MLRYCVAFCAICAGGLAAAADFAIGVSVLPPQQRAVPGRRSLEEDLFLFEVCVTFYGVAYATGRILYRCLGARAQAEELGTWSRSHMVVLNAVGGCWLVGSSWTELLQAVVRPGLVVGVLLLVMACHDGWRAWRGQGKFVRSLGRIDRAGEGHMADDTALPADVEPADSEQGAPADPPRE
jgi:hypothetical protein